MLFGVLLTMHLCHVLSFSTDTPSNFVFGEQPSLGETETFDNSLVSEENVTNNISEVNSFEDLAVYVNTTITTSNDTFNKSNSSVNIEISQFINSTNIENSTQPHSEVSVENNKEEIYKSNETKANIYEFETSDINSNLEKAHAQEDNNVTTSSKMSTNDPNISIILNEKQSNVSFIKQNTLDSDSIHQHKGFLKRNKRAATQKKAEENGNVETREGINLDNKTLQTGIRRMEEEQNKTSDNNMLGMTTNDNSFDKTFEYSEEDLSVGVHTGNKTYGYQQDLEQDNSTRSEWSEDIKTFIRLLKNLPGGKEKLAALRAHNSLLTHNTGPQEFYLPSTCLIEWEDCKTDGECCEPLYCSLLPSFPNIVTMNNSTTIEIKRFCSKFRSPALENFGTDRPDIQEILNSYKKKLMEVLND